jgi:chemotaxis protein methyltransferase CheR
LSRITISRFYRDRAVFDHLGAAVLPALAASAVARKEPALHGWSAGVRLGRRALQPGAALEIPARRLVPSLAFAVVATDADERLLERAGRGCYPRAALRELPQQWIDEAFARDDGLYRLRQDIRAAQPEGPFDLVLCRNLVFTYFDAGLQRRALMDIAPRLRPGGALVVGKNEVVPDAASFEASPAGLGVYRKARSDSRGNLMT